MRFSAGPIDTIKEVVNEAQARAIVYALREGMKLARNAVNYLSPTTLPEVLLATPWGWAVRWAFPDVAARLVSEHKQAALKNIADEAPRIDKLAGEWFQAAKTGIPSPDGLRTWTQWRENAWWIADALQDYVKYQSNASVLFNAPQLIVDLVISTVNCATNPLACAGRGLPQLPIPGWVWAVAAGAALIGGAYVFNTFAPRR